MKLQPPKNENYCATLVELKTFKPLEGCDNLKAAIIYGNQVIIGKDEQIGAIGLFFPIECALSHEFLSANNLYRKAEYGNVDPAAKTGFFDENGRVRAMKLRGHRSEGFWIPLESLAYLNYGFDHMEDNVYLGATFDHIGDHEICRKYVPKCNQASGTKAKTPRISLLEQIVPNQFRFHSDTAQLKRNLHKLKPEDIIVITDKWHGTSCILANLLVKRKLNFWERLLQKFGAAICSQEYAGIWASRRVLKGIIGNSLSRDHFYKEDVWAQAWNQYYDKIPKGFTAYGEIVGYTWGGAEIQKGYTYGCQVGDNRFIVYRVTYTNPDGLVEELSWPRLKTFCVENGFEHVREIFYGRAVDFLPKEMAWSRRQDWNTAFLEELQVMVDDQMCVYNALTVPSEGIVVRVESVNGYENFKLKNFAFLERETKLLDKGEVDMETAQDVG